MRPRRAPLLLLLAGLALVGAACTSSTTDSTVATPGGNSAPASTSTPEAGDENPPATAAADVQPARSFAGVDPAPEFPSGLDWLNTNRPLTLEELKGKVVVLDFWTYGCINCIHIIPDLERLEREFDEELVVIGVHSAKFSQEGATENIRQVVLRYDLEHPVVNDRDFQVWQTWGAQAWPTVVVIDPAGNVVGGHSGEGVYEILQPVITSLVAEFDANGILQPSPADFRLESEGLPNTILSFPGKVHADPERDRLFVADTNHHRIVVARISDGEVLDVFGSGRAGYDDGAALRATFDQPQGMVLDATGQYLYVADVGNHAVRTIDLDDRRVETLVGTGRQAPTYPPRGGMGVFAELSSPWDVTRDGDTLYVAMAGSHQIFSVDLETATAVAFAGNGRETTRNGPRLEAELAQPSGVALDGMGRLYFADSESSSIRYAELGDGGEVDVIAGSDANLFDFGDIDGVGTDARLQHPLGVSFLDGTLYFADTYNSKIKAIDPATEQVTTLFGGEAGWQDGADPRFYEPGGLHAVDGKLYVADTNNHAIRIVDLATGETATLLLSGIERFNPAPGDEEYTGTVIVLDEVEAAEGPGTIVLDVALPAGHKVNDTAPSSMEWRAAGGVAEFDADADRSLTGEQFPQEVGVTFAAGSGEITGDVTIIWCADDAESLCFIEQLRVSAPVTVGTTGTDTITVPYEITLPDA